MPKTSKKKRIASSQNKLIHEIESRRTGGQIALSGFSYQLLFSCYIVLKFLDNDNKVVKLEGIEDVDLYKSVISDSQTVYHIQLKYSKDKQDASFFESILKNFLEVYLSNNENEKRFFKLVYDTDISTGSLSKLIGSKLDKSSNGHWERKIEKLKIQYPYWNWIDFNWIDFCKQLQFEKFSKDSMENSIKKLIIERFSVDTGNENLFVNSLFYNIFHKAQNRDKITYYELLQLIQDIKDDIAKGYQNPSYQWIDKISFEALHNENLDKEYFEGKRAKPADIVNGLPVRREYLENVVKESIKENQITIIKSSSGQGKTTLAWQVAYSLKNEYSIYKLNWCKESKEINNIIEYFNSRLKLGEKILIIIDNLDEELKEWNKLSHELAEKLTLNYSILITTREDDWYALSGEQSNLSRLKIVDLFMDTEQAERIYDNLKAKNRIHNSIQNWQSPWEKVQARKLLIEYVYLLTHGEMIEERISHQLKKISEAKNAFIKLELLRQIALSDTIGVRLPASKLLEQFENVLKDDYDLNSIIQSIENEYFIKIDKGARYVEGLHPVRSKHIVKFLHEYYPISKTLTKLLNIVDELYIEKMYSQIPLYLNENQDEFYSNLARIAKDKSYLYMTKAIQGVFSGSIFKYYNDNKDFFDDADKHGGLFLFSNEINPWNSNQFGVEVKTIEEINKITPNNKNIEYLLELSNTIEKFNIKKSDFYIYSYYLFLNLKNQLIKRDISSFAYLAKWLIRVDKKFDILSGLNFDEIWEDRKNWEFNELAQLMYEFHALSEGPYLDFITKNKNEILSYLRIKTNTLKIYEESDGIHVKYILLPQDTQKGNEESVNRINSVCRFLPIYKTYFADSIRPQIELTNGLYFHDESHKEMPLRNIIIAFNTDLTEIWSKSILSHYEFASVYDWQNYWIDLRSKVIEFTKLNIKGLEKILKRQKPDKAIFIDMDEIRGYIFNSLICEKLLPHEKRPFEERSEVNEYSDKMKTGYFSSIRNYLNQFINIFQKKVEDNLCNLAIINLKDARYKLKDMQECFKKVCSYTVQYFDVSNLESQEILWLDRLIILNEYFLDNAPYEMFNRHDVVSWKQKRLRDFNELINDKISEAEANSGLVFIKPVKVLYEANLATLPIGVTNLDVTNQNELTLLTLSLMPFAEVDINFIVLIVLNDQQQSLANGIRINTYLFKEMKRRIEDDKDLEMGIMTTHLPCEITNEHLNCFHEYIELISTPKCTELEGIDIYLLSLWEYSQYQNYLSISKNEEKNYLINKLKEKTREIEKNLNLIKDKIAPCFLDRLIELKEKVIKNKMTLTDADLNNWINELIIYYNERLFFS